MPLKHIFHPINVIYMKPAPHKPQPPRKRLRSNIIRPNRHHEIRHSLLRNRPTH